MKRFGVALVGLSLAISANAFIPNKEKLAKECVNIAHKLDAQHDKYESSDCRNSVSGLVYTEAAKSILVDDYLLAREFLKQGIRELQYAKMINCPNKQLLSKSINSGKRIIKAIS